MLDCNNSDDTNELRSSIEAVAYSRKYSFSSVESTIPTPYVYAFSCLEAVRRGVDLYDASGDYGHVQDKLQQADPDKARAFIRFSEALEDFEGLWAKQHKPSPPSILRRAFRDRQNKEQLLSEAQDVFLRAIKLHEAQGVILLTDTDGSRVEGQGNNAHIVIHVDPVRFANLVRRIVDVRLLDPEKRAGERRALETFASSATGRTLFSLSQQHGRFIQAGEVSKDYLKFLWLHRDLHLGPASKDSRPLSMTDDDVDAMVDSLLHVRMMFKVRNDVGGYVPDRYVVPSCLPDYVAGNMDPETMLDLDMGSAMFSQELEVRGVCKLPPGLIPRMVAWCGQGKGHIMACWRHGVCFTFKEHMVLVYEHLGSDHRKAIVCHAKGDANTETAGIILEEVASEVDNLVRDKRYGFPGVEFWLNPRDKIVVSNMKQLRNMLQKLEDSLEDYMNLKFDELEKQSERIAGERRASIPFNVFVAFHRTQWEMVCM